jgi:hypothetical protein
MQVALPTLGFLEIFAFMEVVDRRRRSRHRPPGAARQRLPLPRLAMDVETAGRERVTAGGGGLGRRTSAHAAQHLDLTST